MALSNILTPNVFNLYANSESFNNNNANPTGDAKTLWVDQNNKLFFGAQNISDTASGGSITQIDVDIGLIADPDPITGIGSMRLDDTTVVPGTYTAANITVNQNGLITGASNGTGITMSSYTPTINVLSGTTAFTNVFASYVQFGNIVYVYGCIRMVTSGTATILVIEYSLPITASLPINPTNGNLVFPQNITVTDANGLALAGASYTNVYASNTTTTIRLQSTVTFSAGNTRFFSFYFSYLI